MSTDAPAPSRLKHYRLTVNQFLASIDASVFCKSGGGELLGGVVVHARAKGTTHDFVLDSVAEAVRRLMPEGWIPRAAKPLQISEYSRLEADVAIVRGSRSQFTNRTSHARETAMVIEVSDSSYPFDRAAKLWR